MNDVDAAFDAVGKASKLIVLHDKRNAKIKQITEVTKKVCGNCQLWMKTGCKPEKEHKQFKSCSSCACKDFILNEKFSLIEKFKSELAELDLKIKNFNLGVKE